MFPIALMVLNSVRFQPSDYPISIHSKVSNIETELEIAVQYWNQLTPNTFTLEKTPGKSVTIHPKESWHLHFDCPAISWLVNNKEGKATISSMYLDLDFLNTTERKIQILTHELGHILGLSDSLDEKDVMFFRLWN